MKHKDFKTAAELLSTEIDNESPRAGTFERHNEIKNNQEGTKHIKKARKKIMLAAVAIFLAFVGSVFAAKFAGIKAYATVDRAIKIDIIGSSNDESYSLGTVYQGESKWSPKIKLINNADRPFNINISISVISGNASDVSFEIWDETKSNKLTNPYTLSSGSTYFYILHNFSENIAPGNYTFAIDVLSV